jgi:hypothetical protein
MSCAKHRAYTKHTIAQQAAEKPRLICTAWNQIMRKSQTNVSVAIHHALRNIANRHDAPHQHAGEVCSHPSRSCNAVTLLCVVTSKVRERNTNAGNYTHMGMYGTVRLHCKLRACLLRKIAFIMQMGPSGPLHSSPTFNRTGLFKVIESVALNSLQ